MNIKLIQIGQDDDRQNAKTYDNKRNRLWGLRRNLAKYAKILLLFLCKL